MAKEYTPYWEKLRDPRWQKKRLEIMQRDGFECTECGDKDSTLNVHHGHYKKDTDPWDYPDQSLRTLCEDCHKTYKKHTDFLKKIIGYLDIFDVHILIGKSIQQMALKESFTNALVEFDEDFLHPISIGLSRSPFDEYVIDGIEEFLTAYGNKNVRLGELRKKIFSLEKTNNGK